MTERLYTLRIGQTDGRERSVQVRSETDVQAADAAAPLLSEGETILSISEIPDDGAVVADAPAPRSQAAELAPVTPGVAAAPQDIR
ncbi:hypothetical protein [Brevundimonas intermedia]|uniref:hypothetical protein n=1 Tax=Brevundimonas intermedia TaxID=74315 RepID=UPI00320A52CE